MKIRKFNRLTEATILEKTNQYILCEYDAGGTVVKTILFDTTAEMDIYLLNEVNDFILDARVNEESMDILDEEIDYTLDENNIPIITNADHAYNWINEFNNSSEPTYVTSILQKTKNLKLDPRIAIHIDAKKYNL